MTDKEKLKEIFEIIKIDIPNGRDTFSALGEIADIAKEE
jgi:hypothetical protein